MITLLWEIEIIYSVIKSTFPNVFLLHLCFSTLFYICASPAECNFTAKIWGHSFMMSRKKRQEFSTPLPLSQTIQLWFEASLLESFNWHLISLTGNDVLEFFSKNLNNINALTNNFFLCLCKQYI